MVIIEADTDNNNENDNPKVEFRQDGGGIIGRVGITGDAGVEYAYATTNAVYLGSLGNSNLQLFTSNTASFTLTTNGNVGIGTTTPTGLLQIGNATSSPNLFSTSGSFSNVMFGGQNTVNTSGTGVWSFVNNGTGVGTRLFVQDANNLNERLTFDFRGNSGNNQILAGTSTGNVGIGTTSPNAKLHISSSLSGSSITKDGTEFCKLFTLFSSYVVDKSM
jgi:hypothetical protein